jgi:hypothetical protein
VAGADPSAEERVRTAAVRRTGAVEEGLLQEGLLREVEEVRVLLVGCLEEEEVVAGRWAGRPKSQKRNPRSPGWGIGWGINLRIEIGI